jgi:hypothetical protein
VRSRASNSSRVTGARVRARSARLAVTCGM